MTSRGWYFYLLKGKTTGPFAKTEVEEAISRGLLGPFDLIYREGEEKWLPLHQFTDFKGLFKSQIKVEIEETWVVLVRRDNEHGVSYLQRGPFSAEKIKKMLMAGEIRYRDFIWREGQAQWIRISAVELFSPPPVAWSPATSLPQDVQIEDRRSRDEILHEVVAQKKPVLPFDLKPEEAHTEDLTKVAPAPSVERRAPVSKTTKAPFNPERRVKKNKEELFDKLERKRLPVLGLTVGFGFLAIVGFLYFNKHQLMRYAGYEVVEEAETLVKTKARAKAPTVPEKTPVVQAEPPPVPAPEIPRVEPTRIKATISRGEGSKITINFATDGSFHFPIQLTILGSAGDVLGQVSVYREITVRATAELAARLELDSLALPDGQYQLFARCKSAKDELRFRLGKDNREFRKKLDRHRKLISLPFQRERRRLIRASRELHEMGANFRQLTSASDLAWRAGYKRWRESLSGWLKSQLDGINVASPKTLVFPTLWQDLLQVYAELKHQSQETDKRRRTGSSAGNAELNELMDKLRLYAEQAQALSLYR